MRPEIEIILLALRSNLDSEKERRLRQLLAEDLDWSFLSLAAVGHNVCSPLNELLERIEFKQNLTVLIRLEDEQLQRHHKLLADRLCRLQPQLQNAGMDFTFMDGALITGPPGGTIKNRNICEIDLFAISKDIPRLAQILAQQGICPTNKWNNRQIANEFFSSPMFMKLEHTKEYTAITENKTLAINVHWGTDTRITIEQMLDHTIKQEITGCELTTLESDLKFVYICAHAAKHGWDKLILISDIARALENGIAWREIVRLSKSIGLFGTVQVGISLAHTLFNVEIPKEFLPIDETLANVAVKTIESYDRVIPPVVSASELPKWRRIWQTYDSKFQSAQQIAMDIFTPNYRDWRRFNSPQQLFWLLYVLRPASKGYFWSRKLLKLSDSKTSRNSLSIPSTSALADERVMWDQISTGQKFRRPETVSTNYQRVLIHLLLGHALGEYAGSKTYENWVDRAPDAVSKTRLQNLAKDEMKHAKLIMALLEPFGFKAQKLVDAFDNTYHGFFLKPVESWSELIVFNLLVDGGLADHYLHDYADCNWEPWCDAMRAIQIDEETHLATSDQWILEAAQNPLTKASVQHALNDWLPRVERVFGATQSKPFQEACIYGLKFRHTDEVRRLWHSELEAQLNKYGYEMPSPISEQSRL